MLVIIYRDYPAWGKMEGRQAQILQRHVVRVTSVDVRKSQSYSLKIKFIAARCTYIYILKARGQSTECPMQCIRTWRVGICFLSRTVERITDNETFAGPDTTSYHCR